MFQVVRASDNVRVEPDQLGRPLPDSIKAALSASFIDKVVPDLGLVICVYDVEKFEGGHIYPGDGAAHYEVTFRLVVFIPFVGEVIAARLVKSTREGLHLSCGFFHDIFVPSYGLPEKHVFDGQSGLWTWECDDRQLEFDEGEEVRMRVQAVNFRPVPTRADMKMEAEDGGEAIGSAARPYAPMQIEGQMRDEGLGLVCWWADASDDDDDDDEGEEVDEPAGSGGEEAASMEENA